MLRFGVVALILSCISASSSWATQPHGPSSSAPRHGMLPEFWSSGVKQAFGTAFEAYDSEGGYSAQSPTAPVSKVWFTVAQGALTEVYWPQLDRPQSRDTQFLVVDDSGALWEERRDGLHDVRWIEDGVPAFRITTRDLRNRFVIEKTLFADPNRDVVRMKVSFRVLQRIGSFQLFLLHNPTVGASPMSNHAVTGASPVAPGPGLHAWDRQQAQTLLSSLPFARASASFSGPHDLFQDLSADGRMDWTHDEAHDGNVVLGAEILRARAGTAHEFELALGFGSSVAESQGAAAA